MDDKDSETKPLSEDFSQSLVEEDSPPLTRCPSEDTPISINTDPADASGKLQKKKKKKKIIKQTKACSKLIRDLNQNFKLSNIKLHLLEMHQLNILWHIVNYYSQLVLVTMMLFLSIFFLNFYFKLALGKLRKSDNLFDICVFSIVFLTFVIVVVIFVSELAI